MSNKDDELLQNIAKELSIIRDYLNNREIRDEKNDNIDKFLKDYNDLIENNTGRELSPQEQQSPPAPLSTVLEDS